MMLQVQRVDYDLDQTLDGVCDVLAARLLVVLVLESRKDKIYTDDSR